MNRRPAAAAPPSRPRTLAAQLVAALSERMRRGRRGPLAPGQQLPTEAALMAEFGVSRTVVREALSHLQAAGLVDTRHGVGTFVSGAAGRGERHAPRAFRIGHEQLATLQDVVAVLELRIGVETEAAALAAQRRSDDNLRAMRQALADFAAAIEAGGDAVAADFELHHEIARATHNGHFTELLGTLGARIIPRARLEPGAASAAERRVHRAYLERVHGEHESIVDAIAARDSDAARAAMRTHLANSRERRRREALPLRAPAAPAAAARRPAPARSPRSAAPARAPPARRRA